jgi:aryl-alcohol dehydrogenase-like predicted oxidoreductase
VQFRTIGRTDLRVSEIGFGCGPGAGLMVGDDRAAQVAAIARALERGITYFDTAPIYGNLRSETNLGRALRELGATPVIATKIALELDDLDDIPAAVERSIEGSCARLFRDQLDIVYLHNRVGATRAAKADIGVGALLTVDDVLGKRGIVETLQTLRERGRVRNFGCCAFGGERIATEALVDSGAFESILVNYSMLNQTAFNAPSHVSSNRDYQRIGARAAARGMSAIALRVLEGGALAGADSFPQTLDATARDAVAALAFLNDDAGTLITAAIRFALANVAVASVLIGFSAADQVDPAVDAANAGPLDHLILEKVATLV